MVRTGLRPGGSSSITLMSSSAYRINARVRGMGVADMTSTCGRCAPFAAAARVADPEPVLFVGDDEGEAVKPDVVRNDGVRPDQQFDPAVRQRGERLPPLFCGRAAGETGPCAGQVRRTGRGSG